MIVGRACCRCGVDLSIGEHHGRRYYNKKEWDGKSWVCEKCHNELSRLKTEEIRNRCNYKKPNIILKGRTCCKCRMDLSIGENHGRRYYDENMWDEKSWICERCYNESEKIRRRMNRDKEKYENLKDRKCCVCGSYDTYIYEGISDWAKHKNEKGMWDRKWVCSKCDGKERQKKPDSQNMVRKSVTNVRTGNLRIDSETGKSLVDQAVVVKVLGGKDANVDMNKFDYFVDIKNEKYGDIDVKGAALKLYEYTGVKGIVSTYYRWMFPTRRKIDCSTYICLGYDSERRNIDTVWIIPNDGWISNLSNIDIYKTFRSSKYDQFKVDPVPYDDTYKDLMSYIGDRKYFGIEDIEKWLEIK